MNQQKAFSDMTRAELEGVVADCFNGLDPSLTNAQSAMAELHRRYIRPLADMGGSLEKQERKVS